MAVRLNLLGEMTYLKRDFIVVEGKDRPAGFGNLGVNHWFLAVSLKDYDKYYFNNMFYGGSEERKCKDLGFRTKELTKAELSFFRSNKERFYLDKQTELGNFYKLK